MLPDVMQETMPYIALFNFAVAAAILIAAGTWAGHRTMREVPGGVQNLAEYVLEWFVKQSRAIGPGLVMLVAPFTATLFMLILLANLMGIVPLPVLRVPPTAFYAVPFALALTAVFGGIVLNAFHHGIIPALTHLVWPNPIQLISEVSHVLSLSLRLYGNIAGEFMVSLLVLESAPYGIPIIIHGLGLIPACVQPLVFTLLTFSFLSTALQHEPTRKRAARSRAWPRRLRARTSLRGSAG